jgi:hypothetical protein
MPKYVASYEGSDALNSFLVNDNNDSSNSHQIGTTNLIFGEMVTTLNWRNPISRELVNHLLRTVMGQTQVVNALTQEGEDSENDEERQNGPNNEFNSG